MTPQAAVADNAQMGRFLDENGEPTVMGIALLLTGIGFLVLTARVLWPAGAPAKTARKGSAVPTTS